MIILFTKYYARKRTPFLFKLQCRPLLWYFAVGINPLGNVIDISIRKVESLAFCIVLSMVIFHWEALNNKLLYVLLIVLIIHFDFEIRF